ncbi:hypothetical protein KC330_g592 [Hortaea werneckii]|nr:hypothetical protein KC330_g592 [Hortaea werneckii]
MASVDRSKVASLYTRILLQDLPTTPNTPNLPTLSLDIIDTILSFLGLDATSLNKIHHFPDLACPTTGLAAAMDDNNHPAETPPSDGKCPFMTLPAELRRAIFAESLPARNVTIPVRCEDDEHKKKNSRDDHRLSGGNRAHSTTTTTTISSSSSSSSSPSSSFSPTPTPSPGQRGTRPRTLDLLTLNRALCAELTELLYTEREFAVHVHEGLHSGGIEFLNSGRQPLQYYGYDDDDEDDGGCGVGDEGGRGRGGKAKGGGGRVKDPRFAGKFHSGAPFGLDRVKKVKVVVLPPPPPPPRGRKGRERKEDGRMVSMNTYYMNLALVRLLERAEGPGKGRENRITRVRVEVADRREGKPEDEDDEEDNPNPNPKSSSSSSFNSSWWWDPHRSRPRETTFHGISNLQLVLLPFSRLRAHHVEILLPPSCAAQLASDPATGAFLRHLEGKITGSSSSLSAAAAAAAGGMDDLPLDDEKVLRNLEKARFAYEAFVFRIKFGEKGEGVALLGEGDWEGEKVQEVVEEEEKEEGEVLEEDGLDDDEDEGDVDSEGDEVEMQWALQQSLDQAAEEAEKELQQAIRESLWYDKEGSPGPAEDDDRDRRYYRGVSEDLEEMWLEDDEYDMGLSEGIDDFGFEDDEEEPGVSEDGGESDLNEASPTREVMR